MSSGPGTWVVRRYQGDGAYTVTNLRTPDGRLVVADDYSDPDGETVLSFGQAQTTALASRPKSDASAPYTVRRAVESYIESKEAEGRNTSDPRYRGNAHIYPALGDTPCSELTTDQIRNWHRGLAKMPPRVRTKPGSDQAYNREFNGDDENSARARRVTANRILATLRVALNHAFNEGKVTSDAAWRKVKPFKEVNSARLRYLSVDEAQRLINACDPGFRPLVQAALQTGARYGQLAKLVVSDFNPDAGTVRVRTRKGSTGAEREYHRRAHG